MEWIFLGLGLFVGVFIGILITCLMVVSKESDEAMGTFDKNAMSVALNIRVTDSK